MNFREGKRRQEEVQFQVAVVANLQEQKITEELRVQKEVHFQLRLVIDKATISIENVEADGLYQLNFPKTHQHRAIVARESGRLMKTKVVRGFVWSNVCVSHLGLGIPPTI